MAEIDRPWDDATIASEQVGKKDVIQFLQANAAQRFLADQKLQGSLKNVVKTSKKDNLVKAYNEMFAKKAFKGSEYDVPMENVSTATAALTLGEKKQKKN
ncbi:unnamed protein product [Clavelina lepadiformis]|uniref:FKBP3 basic tilted helix bundle domain-containing protein n=1 Tax=Clavelina lepadiformis TaxID=159417 RepID=A0ABP0F205_CLALP